MLLVINSDFIEEKHICWYVKNSLIKDNSVDLCEVVERKYPHPQAPDDAFIWVTATEIRKTLHRTDFEAGALIVLEASQKSLCYQQEKMK